MVQVHSTVDDWQGREGGGLLNTIPSLVASTDFMVANCVGAGSCRSPDITIPSHFSFHLPLQIPTVLSNESTDLGLRGFRISIMRVMCLLYYVNSIIIFNGSQQSQCVD